MVILSKSVAFITGAARGLGKATAQRLIKQGAKVVIVDISRSEVDAAVLELGKNAIGVVADVTSEEQINDAIKKAIDSFGSVSIGVNCAGT